MILDSLIFLVITLNDYDPLIVVDILLSKIIISVFMVIINTILFYMLKDKEPTTVAITKVESNSNDLGIEEIVKEKKIPKKNITKSKTSSNSRNNQRNSGKKVNKTDQKKPTQNKKN